MLAWKDLEIIEGEKKKYICIHAVYAYMQDKEKRILRGGSAKEDFG